MIEKYGADTCRLFTLFAAPPEKDMPWIEASVGGQRRFLERVFRFVTRNMDRESAGDPAADRRALRKLHQTIRKVTEDFDNRWHFNTSIAALMELLNTLCDEEAGLSRAALDRILPDVTLMLEPFAPYTAEELWEQLGRTGPVFRQAWPSYDAELAKEEAAEIVLQVNGKLRGRLSVPFGTTEEELKRLALCDPKVQPSMEGKNVVKVIVVPDKLVNIGYGERMPTEMLISVEEYLGTSYRPDCDYVDGRIEERNVGERDHRDLHMAISAYLYARRKQWGIQVYPEQRVQVRPDRFRVPDVCVVAGTSDEQILTKPPFLCVEVLSPDDRMIRIETRIDDYLAMGVAYVWVLDPQTRKAYAATAATGLCEVKSGILKRKIPRLKFRSPKFSNKGRPPPAGPFDPLLHRDRRSGLRVLAVDGDDHRHRTSTHTGGQLQVDLDHAGDQRRRGAGVGDRGRDAADCRGYHA